MNTPISIPTRVNLLRLESLPPIPIQAHFEGVVFSVRAAVEQITKAIKLVRKTDFNKTLRKFASATTNMRLKELAKWFNDPLFEDLRTIRNSFTHASYDKTRAESGTEWKVEKPAKSKYGGCRELRQYCQAAVAQAEERVALIQDIEAELQIVCETCGGSRKKVSP